MRIQGVEIEDLSGYPDLLRSLQTDYLRFISSLFGVYKPGIKLAAEIIEQHDIELVYDLGSGGGGAIPGLYDYINKAEQRIPEIVLTDLYPNKTAASRLKNISDGHINYDLRSLPALTAIEEVPKDKKTLVTIFNMFHHLEEEAAKTLLKRISEQGHFVLMVEPLDKSILQIFINIFVTLIMAPVFTLFVKPVRVSRYLFSYFIPIVPLVTCFDGIFSVLRLYSVKHLKKITGTINGLNWTAGKLKFTFGKTIYLLGKPQ
ncbi:hypothetical protein OO013_13575 [Mangrovivirga sp. M17]|uniref:Class I SAM-dependent methyltransferase n=1 Tax=Mangrovivirga halotolerans TaxID=2993936 RepID=A0ABT3RUI5_9BACT|nr:hypothetical protein [Mangrovivirga halotolerans]MCX2744907.1 hypothetical protein [Mangrovivirga halotolerans]